MKLKVAFCEFEIGDSAAVVLGAMAVCVAVFVLVLIATT